MKKALVLVFASLLVTVGCGAAKQVEHTSPSASAIYSSMAGGWTFSLDNGGTIEVNLMPEDQCSVSTPVGIFTVAPSYSSCFATQGNTPGADVEMYNGTLFPVSSVYLGQSTNNEQSVLIIEADNSGNVAVINVTNPALTLTNQGDGSAKYSMTGTWTCNVASPICSGMTGTMTGNQ